MRDTFNWERRCYWRHDFAFRRNSIRFCIRKYTRSYILRPVRLKLRDRRRRKRHRQMNDDDIENACPFMRLPLNFASLLLPAETLEILSRRTFSRRGFARELLSSESRILNCTRSEGSLSSGAREERALSFSYRCDDSAAPLEHVCRCHENAESFDSRGQCAPPASFLLELMKFHRHQSRAPCLCSSSRRDP